MFGLGLPDGIVILIGLVTLLYAVFMFLLPFFVYTIRYESIRTNRLLEQILDAVRRDQPKNIKPATKSGPVTCEVCGKNIAVEDFVPHAAQCLKEKTV